MGRENIGPPCTNVWNSPFSPHGSAVARQLGEQCLVEPAAGEPRVDLRLVHADDRRLEAVGDERIGERARRSLPERIEAAVRRAGEQSVAVVAHVAQVEIAEGYEVHCRMSVGQDVERVEEGALIRRVGRLRLEPHLDERQAERGRLRLEQRAPHAVDAHAVVLARDAREQRDHVVRSTRAEMLEGERAVLPAAPAQGDRFTHGDARFTVVTDDIGILTSRTPGQASRTEGSRRSRRMKWMHEQRQRLWGCATTDSTRDWKGSDPLGSGPLEQKQLPVHPLDPP